THIAYEFTTGTGWARRREHHAAWLRGLARDVPRPLHLVVRGGTDLLGQFAATSAGVTVLETDSFMWTMKRQQAVLKGSSSIRRRPAPTEKGAPLDALLAENILTNRNQIENLMVARSSSVTTGRA